MPCTDVDERITVELDCNDLVVHYALDKISCGRPVGPAGWLLGSIGGLSAEALAERPTEALVSDHLGDEAGPGRFITEKHVEGLQLVLRVYLGREACGPSRTCRALQCECGADGTRLVGYLSVDMPTHEISPCDGSTPCSFCSVGLS